ncbi:ferredoxin III, nif-specific [Cereibacter johrii]|uniref:ferredoxin III, nif-specific n=1 Tax=Cereibacter johrii TaxID=445629 RepID=UPI000DCB14E2|nr:ferredoxin III, nif-specific [Cereibacter johrii]QCP84789.1 ferredoxin III, nif-specific [Cereibacter sphaeroides]RAZ82238.1 ferredoxin III, nif-specific [Cereibacter johrii]RDS97519.1 ferredoxin III, nif-specific [Cereibacter sphaeroides f. sp. denitrificans]
MFITAFTRGGTEYTPKFLISIDLKTCIGCGRCYKVCGQDVLALRGVTEEGELVDCSDDEDDDDEILRKVMVMAHPELCVGCGACARVCPKDCQTHEPVER